MARNGNDEQIEFEIAKTDKPQGPVECLGLHFATDEERRSHFLEKLKQKLQEPEFRKTEGFPQGTDEDILALSDPPFYTACPNPFLSEFILRHGKSYDPASPYHREPFAADVSEGKNDSIYLAHSYHTKVPHKAIMRYILHYTNPGDVVFDGFCGTGMTGVAAHFCGDRNVVQELGYQVSPDGIISREEVDETGTKKWVPFSKLGSRAAILSELAPSATFIAHGYNTPASPTAFEQESNRILSQVNRECGWMYQTLHSPTPTQLDSALKEIEKNATPNLQSTNCCGVINYTLWSDVLVCPECATEIVFWDEAVNAKTFEVNEHFNCPKCSSKLTKSSLERAWTVQHDAVIGDQVRMIKQKPVLISYSYGSKKQTKRPDSADLAIIAKIENGAATHWEPNARMIEGKEARRNDPVGITHVHQFYYKRALKALACYRAHNNRVSSAANLTSVSLVASKLYRFRSQGGSLGAGGGPMSGTLYIPSLIKEIPVPKLLKEHISKTTAMKAMFRNRRPTCVGTVSMAQSGLPPESVDYLFLDPPFGSNLMYSELNFIWEAWLKVTTNSVPEAIENPTQKKSLDEYRALMTKCFIEAYRVLKP